MAVALLMQFLAPVAAGQFFATLVAVAFNMIIQGYVGAWNRLKTSQLQRRTKSKIPYVYRIHNSLRYVSLGNGGDSNPFDIVPSNGIFNHVGRRTNWISVVDNYLDSGSWNIPRSVNALLLHAIEQQNRPP